MTREEKIKINKRNLLIALEKHLGIVTPACKEVGLSRDRFYHYYKNDEDFKKAVDEINEVTLDFVETQLLKSIKSGSERSILFYMKYKGRKRGYNDNLDITSNGETMKNITFEIIQKNKSENED